MSYEDRKSTWKVIRRGSAGEEVRKHRDGVTGAWKQISIQRRRVDISNDPSMAMALRPGTWMDGERFKKSGIREKEKRGRRPPTFLRHMGSALHAKRCRKIYAGKVIE